ncbi:hypothetical protein Tco_0479344 [Tanacetum coccineum]
MAVPAIPYISGGRQAYKGAATKVRLCFCLFVGNVVSVSRRVRIGGSDFILGRGVSNVKEVSLINGVFDGVFGGDGEEEVVIGEGVVVTSSSLEMLTKSCLGEIMVSLIFLEGLEEKA